jgi:asparagine synthase (glutamine-hydrolysing)
MSTQSGLFTFDRDATLLCRQDDLWCGDAANTGVRRHPSGVAATCDGRIDNREELLLRLGSGVDAREAADLVIAMLNRHGIDGLEAILGEWAAVIWDAARRTLHLARDYMGARPLYYAVSADSAAWSTDLAELVTRTSRTSQLSDRFAAGFMSLSPRPDATPYDGVHAVPPGVCVSIASDGRVTHRRLWRIAANEIRYRDPRAYEEQLRSLWRDAVRVRLQTTDTVWAELSGGLDSSAVVCMADWVIKRRAAAAPALRLVSHATLESPEGDERRFIAEVERQVAVRSEIVGVEKHQESNDSARAWVTPYVLQGVGLETVYRVQAGGGRLVLSGRLGDAVMGCQPDNSVAVLEDLARGRLIAALQNVRAWSRATRKPFLQIAFKLLSGDARPAPDTAVDLLTPRLREMVRDTPGIAVPSSVRPAKRPLARMVLGYSEGARLDIPHRSPDIVYAYPFTHRPLVDFILAIPGEQLSAPGTTRSLMRRAFAPFVPPRVIRRVSKGYYPPAAYRAARRLVTSMDVRDLEVVERGWIDPDRLQAAIRELTAGRGETGGDIHAVLRLESWLQARRGLLSIPQRKEVKTNEVLNA